MSFQEQYDAYKALVENRLTTFFTDQGLEEAMRYSLLAGGKRIRPVLTMAFCVASGGEAVEGLDFGCGVEMLHTYSLIHDDLPAMDNDDLRRGKHTCHKVYGETVAILAGDALQSAAFRTILSAAGPWQGEGKLAPLTAARILAEAAGEKGMCLGQYDDTIGDGQAHTAEELTAINDAKTGALLRAACMLGVVAASGCRTVDDSCLDAAREYATNLGLAFQIQDDILDVTSTVEELGKPIGSDAENGKSTYVSLLGVAECEKRVEEYTRRAIAALDGGKWTGDTEFLKALANSLATRSN